MLVYKITNTQNARAYIGITTVALQRRWIGHVFDANDGNPRPLYRDMRKLGIDSFGIEALYEATSIGELLAVERGLICAHGTHVRSGGYNCTLGGDGGEHLLRRGEDQHGALLTNDVVEFIRDPAKAGIVNREIVEMVEEKFGVIVARDTVRDARRGESWTHLNAIYPPIHSRQGARTSERKAAASRRTVTLAHAATDYSVHAERLRQDRIAAKLTPAQARAIFLDPRLDRVVARDLGLDHGTIGHIRRRQTWRSITANLTAPPRTHRR